MGLRLILASALALMAFDGAARADDDSGNRHRKRVYRSHRSTGYYAAHGIGGQRYGDEHTPYIYKNGGYSNSPYFDNRTFWERVQTQADYPVR